MAKLMYGSILSDGLRIQYYRTGDEKPALVFLHGAMDNAFCWNNLPIALEPEYDVVLFDARGHGLSAAPDEGFSPQIQAEDVAALIKELKLSQPILIGHSMGADTAAATAAKYPGLVKGVILEDPPWPYDRVGGPSEARADKAREMGLQIASYKAMSFEELLALGRAKHPSWDESEFFQWAKARQLVSPKMVAFITEPRVEWKQLVGQIKCPGLLLTADPEQGALITPQTADEIARLWKQVEVVNIPQVGHSIRRENYPAYRDAVRKYLRKMRRR